MKAIEYNSVSAGNLVDLDNLVNLRIRDGWQPIGGIATLSTPSEFRIEASVIAFYQAMVKHEAITISTKAIMPVPPSETPGTKSR